MKTAKDVTDCRGRAARDWLRGLVMWRRNICFAVTLIGLAALIPVALATVGTPHEWIYWLVGGVTATARLGTFFKPHNDVICDKSAKTKLVNEVDKGT